VRDPFLERCIRLRDSVLARTSPPNADLRPYLEKVRARAHAITDEEVAALLRAGHEEDAIFEHTVGVALGSSIERLEAGLAALEKVKKP
jgi:hypothetical protein